MKIATNSFSLIEVAVTIVVLGVIISGIVPMVSSSFHRAQVSGRKAIAHRLAQERVEELMLVNLTDAFYDDLYGANLTNPVFILLEDAAYGDLRLNVTDPDDPFANFSRISEGSWDLDGDGNLTNENADNTTGNLSLLRVTVAWDFNNDTVDDDQLSVTTFKSNY